MDPVKLMKQEVGRAAAAAGQVWHNCWARNRLYHGFCHSVYR